MKFIRCLSRRSVYFFTVLLVLTGGAVLSSRAQDMGSNAGENGLETSSASTPPIVIERAERIRYFRNPSRIRATGNVVVHYGSRELSADTVYYNESTKTLRARGAVRIVSPERAVTTAREFRLHLPTNRTQLQGLRARYGPIYVSGPSLDGDADTKLKVPNGQFTTCNLKTPHYSIKASQIYIYPGQNIVAWNATANVAGVPVLYLPYAYISSREGFRRWEVRPGHSQETGLELEVDYHYLLPSDPGPYTSTIYTDYREKEGGGGGFDLGYDKPGQRLYFYAFGANRRPTSIDEDGDEVRSDTVQTIWRVKSESNYKFPGTNWTFHSNADWFENNRFTDDLQSSFDGRGVMERQFNGSLVYSGDRSIFRIDAIREDQVVDQGGTVDFQLQNEVLPRVRYQLFSLPFNLFGERLFYSSNTFLEQSRSDPGHERLLKASTGHNLTRSLSWARWWGQTYRVGYEQEFMELAPSASQSTRSLGVGSFGLINSFRPNSVSSVSLNYDIAQQLQRKNKVPLVLGGESYGLEAVGLRTHQIGMTYQWRKLGFSGYVQTGYDLRNGDTIDLEPDTRILSPQLNVNTQLTPRINWGQYLRYDVGPDELIQANSSVEFDWSRQLDLSLGANYNRRTGRDYLNLEHGFRWGSTSGEWGVVGDIVYSQARDKLESMNLAFRKRFHEWDFRIYYQSIRDREQQIFFTLNLVDFPSKALGFSANIADQGLGLEQGQSSDFQP